MPRVSAGVVAWKQGSKRPADTTPSSTSTPPAEPPRPTTEPKKQEQPPRSTLFRPDPAPDRKKKCIRWTMLACLLLALLFGIAVAIAVPVSRQNTAKNAAAAPAAVAKGAKGPPLTFKVDVAVPPDEEDDAAGPLCGSLFRGSQDSSQSVEVRSPECVW